MEILVTIGMMFMAVIFALFFVMLWKDIRLKNIQKAKGSGVYLLVHEFVHEEKLKGR